MVEWFVCHLFHRWIRQIVVHSDDAGAEQPRELCYCLTCGRDRPSWLRA